jgi:hypothetical protein
MTATRGMTGNGRWRSWNSWRYAALALGAALAVASAPAASAPAYAAPSGGPELIRGLGTLTGRLPTGPFSELLGVFCTSPANCWAVGRTETSGVKRNQVLHWTGKHWFKVAVPNPAGTGRGATNELFAVRCTSPSRCWAVGDAKKHDEAADLDQVLHWNGKKWRAVPAPTPGGVLSGDFNVLNDVTCVSARNCWAVGDYGALTPTMMTGRSELEQNQVLHWNGAAWSLASAPNPAGLAPNHINALDGVRCTSASECWAAGSSGMLGVAGQLTLRNEMLRWNGKKWAKATVPDPGGTAKGAINVLDGLACASAASCWAAGLAGSFSGMLPTSKLLGEVLRWNGKKWFKQTVPNPGGGRSGADNALFGITCSSARNCWAVGSSGSFSAGPATLNLALRWNGTKWSLIKTPEPGGTGTDDSNILNSVRCTSAANCWAVGGSEPKTGAERNEIMHWTGKRWFVG